MKRRFLNWIPAAALLIAFVSAAAAAEGNTGRTTTIEKNVTLGADFRVDGDLVIKAPISCGGFSLSVSGNVLLDSDLDLAGGSFSVAGNLHHEDGMVYIDGGLLDVGGNYRLESTELEEDGNPNPSYGWIKMDSDADTFSVGGSFSARSYNASVMTAGTMEFGGDVTDYKGNTIRGSGTHKAVFSGDSLQTVDLQNSSACFQSISTVNPEVRFLQLGICELTENITLTGDAEDIWNKLDLNGYSLELRGNVNRVSADITLNGGHLAVTGNFRQEDPIISFTKGFLQVDGDYLIARAEMEEDGMTPAVCYGWLSMQEPEDRLFVGGNFAANSYNSSVLSAGTMEFQGNVTDYRGNTIRGSGDHRAVFSGNGLPQVVDLKSSSACFETISTPNDQVQFLQSGIRRLTENIILNGDIETIWNKLDCAGYSITVNGSVKNVSSEIDLNGGSFIAKKDFRLVDPMLWFQGGLLQVDGNFRLESPETEEDGTPKTSYGWLKMDEEGGRLIVGGDFSARSYNSSVLTTGTLEFAGDVYDFKGNTIRGSGSNKAVFFGAGHQVVEFANSSACFQSISAQNQDLEFKTWGVAELTEDVVIGGSVGTIWNKLDLNGYSLSILGDVEALTADLNLNGGSLYVAGNFRQLDPSITFHGGTLQIDGDYLLQSAEQEADGSFKTVYGWLNMDNEADHMIVLGDFIAQSYNSSVMSAGTLEIGGEMLDLKGNTLRITGLPGETTLTSGSEVQSRRRRAEQETTAVLETTVVPETEAADVPQTAPPVTQTPETPAATTAAVPETTAAAETSPLKTVQYRVVETDRVFYLFGTEDGQWDHARKVAVYNWKVAASYEVDKAAVVQMTDGGCRLDVSYTPSTNPFLEGPRVSVSCTYEGNEYFGEWSQGIILDEPATSQAQQITVEQQAIIDQIERSAPTVLPPGIIKMGRISFRAYNDDHLPITGYEYAVREGSEGAWKSVQSTDDTATLSAQFPSLKQGETYWYRYRYYVTINGADYFSGWSSEMGDVYTLYDNGLNP